MEKVLWFHNENAKMTRHDTLLLLFDDNKIKMVRKPGKKQKKNPVGRTREGKRLK